MNMAESICIPKEECPCQDENGNMVVPPNSHVTIDCQDWWVTYDKKIAIN